MARPDSEKCRLCSKLSSPEAQQKHGEGGDGCWNPKYCHNRRSYYRHRGVRNHQRKQQLRGQQQQTGSSVRDSNEVITLEIPSPAVGAAVVHWYRETKDSPLHALGAQLWIGNDLIAHVEPVHCLGLTESQVKTLLVRILNVFSEHCGMKIERFRCAVELHPLNCPTRPCPLHPEVNI